MLGPSHTPEYARRKSRSVIKKITSFLVPRRFRDPVNPRLASDDLQDVKILLVKIESGPPETLGCKNLVRNDTRTGFIGDITADIEILKTKGLPPTALASKALATLTRPPQIPALRAPVNCSPSMDISPRSKSLMHLAGTDRDSDFVSPPFNLWEDIVEAVVDLGITSDIVSPRALSRYIDLPERKALWYEESAVAIFKNEITPYKHAIAYISDVSKHVIKPYTSSKKKFAWTELGSFDFRLNAVDKYLENLIRDVTVCKNKCGNTMAERRMASNAMELVEALWELQRSVMDLRETIMYRIIRRHDAAKGKISVFLTD